MSGGAGRLRPTPEQLRAADPAHSVWVTANAGTGKTRVLSDRILRLLLDGAHPESVLAITFTKAAAAEMTARVEAVLARWAIAPDDEELAAELEDLRGEPATPAPVRQARRLFARVLDLPKGLQIMTIHALCTALLRRFPIEAGVPPHFETIDERTAAEMMIEAREQVLTASQSSGPLAKALDILAISLGETSLTAAIQEMLQQRLNLQRVEAVHGGLEGLIGAVYAALGASADVTPAHLVERACRDGEYDAAGLAALALVFAAGGKRQSAEAPKISSWLSLAPIDRVRAFETYKTVFCTADGAPRANLLSEKFRQSYPAEAASYDREQARLGELNDRIKAVTVATRTEALLRVGLAAVDAYERQKAQKAALDFDDLIDRARKLLSSQTDWVLFKLDERIAHVLVDEAQDTSPLQWDLIERLTEEFFTGHGVHERPRTLFVVGDEKQSIYSFQGADLENFRDVRLRTTARAEAAQQSLRRETIERSFRSSRAILELVDAVFADPEISRGVADAGTVIRHLTQRQNDAGHIELWPLVEPEDDGDAAETGDTWPLPGARRESSETHRRLADAIATRIKTWLAEGERLDHSGRLIRPGDILILLQQRGAVQDILIRSLKRAGVPVAGADRLGIVNHIAVMDLMALGNVMLLPEDDLTLAALLKSPLMGLGDAPASWGLTEEELFNLAYDRVNDSLLERLRSFAGSHGGRYGLAYDRLRQWLQRADFMPPFEFFARVLSEDGGRRRLQARLGPDAIEPIEAFLGQALAYEEGHPASLQGFLYWLGQDERQLRRDPEQAYDAVRVMTVHGSKGLEAPIVILADAGPRQNSNHDHLIWDRQSGLPFWRPSKEKRETITAAAIEQADVRLKDEQRRLLYVALTRARDRLYVAGWLPRRANKEPCWHSIVAAALEMIPDVERRDITFMPSVPTQVRHLARGIPIARNTDEASVIVEEQPATLLPSFATTTAPGEPTPAFPLAPSHQDDDEPVAGAVGGKEAATALRRGTLIHALLALAPGLPEAEREKAVQKWLDHRAADFEPAARAEICKTALAILRHPKLTDIFDPSARAEQPIVGIVDGVAISGQIDRMAITEDSVILVDFKTNRFPPADVGSIPRRYIRQMAAYWRLVGRIYPQKDVRCALVWTENGNVAWLPRALLEATPLQRARSMTT